MSFDLGVWFPHKRLSADQAGDIYSCLCDGDTSGILPHPAIEIFYTELTAKYPEIDSIPEDRVDDTDYCPWSCALDKSEAHVIMSCVWPKADYVAEYVHLLAAKHGLAVYDPQDNTITYPGEPQNGDPKKPWWRFW